MIRNVLTLTLLLTLAACANKSAPALDDDSMGNGQDSIEGPDERQVEFHGVVTTRESQVVAAEFEGRVVRLFVRPGQRVKKGDPIAKLDDTRVRSQHTAAVAAADAARAEKGRAGVQVQQAKRAITREKRLYRQGAVARERIRSANFERAAAGASYGAAAASHRKAVAERKQFARQLEQATLLAPIDGVVSIIRVKEGEMARPGTAVARVFDPRDLTARFEVSQQHKGLVKKGTRIEASIPSTGAKFTVTVENVSTALEPPLQFLIADADIDDTSIDSEAIGVGVAGRFRIVDPG